MTNAAPKFSDVLDAKVLALTSVSNPVPAAAGHAGVVTSALFGAMRAPIGAAGRAYVAEAPRVSPGSMATTPSRQLPREYSRPSVPPRILNLSTTAHRSAVRRLRAMGATLPAAAISDHDVKRAYRELARQFHPDTNPDLPAGARADLASRFAEATEAYRFLIAAPRAAR